MTRLFLLLTLLAGPAVAAAPRADVVEALGAISIAPQLCGAVLDREKFAAFEARVGAGDAEFAVDVFRVNDAWARRSATWSPADHQAFCSTARRDGQALGLLG